MSPGCSDSSLGRARQHFAHDEHAGVRREGLARPPTSVAGVQPEATQLVIRRVREHGLQRAARGRLALLNQLQRALHATERQIEARCGAVRATGVERDHATANVDDRRARRTAGRARRRLQIERVEVVVLREAVFRRRAIELRERARENRQLLTRVVADDADLATDLRAFRKQRQRLRLDEAQLRRVVAIDAEVVHRIAIHRIELHFLAIEERRFRRDRARRDDVTVGENQPALGIDDETGGLRGAVPLRVEGARLIDFDRHDAVRDALERDGPVRIFFDRRRPAAPSPHPARGRQPFGGPGGGTC